MPLIVMVCLAPVASGDSLTLDSFGNNWGFENPVFVISGAWVNDVTPQPAAFEAYHLYDKNSSGVWDGGDGRRRSIGTYDNGLFGLFAMTENWGALNGIDAVAGARGILEIDDVVITSTDPSPPATILTSLNFHVSGTTSHFDYYANDIVAAGFDLKVNLNGTSFNGEYDWLQYSPGEPETTVSGLGTQIAGGGFSEDFNSTITTGTVNVPVNSPFSIRMEFGVTTTTVGPNSAYHGMTFDAMNTAGFLPGASIFNLPEGYTANSGGGIIVNNATTVPEPSTLALVALGLLGIGWGRRR